MPGLVYLLLYSPLKDKRVSLMTWLLEHELINAGAARTCGVSARSATLLPLLL